MALCMLIACSKYDTEVESKDFKQGKEKIFIFFSNMKVLAPPPLKSPFLHAVEEIVKTFNSYRFRIHWVIALIMKYHHKDL